ncbi:MAG: Mur ligase family protein, partial [Planctomycetota bacterium]
MTFDELVNLVSLKGSAERPQVRIDSRLVKEGDIFAAIKGTAYDGHDFIEQAVSSGAKYIVSQQAVDCKDAEVIVVEDSAKAAAVLAQASWGRPASKLTSLAVTGTNGKTTVGFLVRSVFQNAGEKCGLIGTVVYDTSAKKSDASLTTPDCLSIAEMADEMVRAGSKYMVIEASSHAIFQKRLAGIDFKAAAFTNLAGDHLDYHKTEKDYLAAKSLLFENLSADATAVLNKQSAHA